MGLNAITFIADHLGSTAPKVQGHYYYVDFILNVTKGATASVTTTVNLCSRYKHDYSCKWNCS